MGGANETLTTTYKMKAAETTLNQYCVAVLDETSEGMCKRASGAGVEHIAGVLRDATLAAGNSGAFQIAGIAWVAISTAVAIGDVLVIGNAAGQVAPKGVGAHTSGTGIVGRALSAASTAGDIVKCILAIPNEFSS